MFTVISPIAGPFISVSICVCCVTRLEYEYVGKYLFENKRSVKAFFT